MAANENRVHFWDFLLNEEGQPIANAEIWVYLAGSTTPADLYDSENGNYISSDIPTFQSYEGANEALSGKEIIRTDNTGYFEFWIGKESELNGYLPTQKFKLKWYKAGIAEGTIDFINIINYATGTDGDGLAWEGDWTDATQYEERDLVSFTLSPSAVSVYICTAAHLSSSLTAPSSGANWATVWDLYSQGRSGTSGTSGYSFDWKGTWITATAYEISDSVSNTTSANILSSFVCTADHTSGATDEPGVGATWKTKWDYISAGRVNGDFTSLITNSLQITGLTASKPVFTDASKNIVSTGTLPIDQGGTGSTTASNAFDALKQNATESYTGVLETATDAEAVAHTATDKIVVPSNLDNVFATPPSLGSTTPSSGAFTTITTTSTATIGAAGTLEGGQSSPTGTTVLGYNGYFYATKVFNNVFNDIADFINISDGENIVYGKCYYYTPEGIKICNKKCQKSVIGITTDTFGYGLGQDDSKAPIAIGGWVLAYTDKEYEPGTPLTNDANGNLTEMSKRQKRNYPERLVAIFMRKEEENKVFNNHISVNGRNWVRVY